MEEHAIGLTGAVQGASAGAPPSRAAGSPSSAWPELWPDVAIGQNNFLALLQKFLWSDRIYGRSSGPDFLDSDVKNGP